MIGPGRVLLLALILALAPSGAALAHDIRAGDLVIDHPWARASAGQAANGAMYVSVTNHGTAVDRLVGVETGAAERAELHAHEIDAAGVMSMHAVEAVDVPAGATIVLAPGGLHVMLFGLAAPLALGTTFEATLTFERAGRVAVEVHVENVGATAPSH